MSYRVFRWVAGTFLIAGGGFIGVLALLYGGDSTDSGGAAPSTTVGVTPSAESTTTTTWATTTTTTQAVRHLDLGEAIVAGMVEVEFRGTGSAPGGIAPI